MSDYDLIETVLIDDLPERCLKCDRCNAKSEISYRGRILCVEFIIIVWGRSKLSNQNEENKIKPNEENKPKPKNAYVKSNRHNRKFHRR